MHTDLKHIQKPRKMPGIKDRFILLKRSIHQQDLTILNVSGSNNRSFRIHGAKLMRPQGEREETVSVAET